MPAFKDEKTGKWFCKFYYTDYTGTKKQKMKRGFSLQREAKEWERAFLEKHAGSPSMSFRAMTELFLEDKKANNKAISYQTRKNRIDNWILPTFGDLPLNEITPADVRKWQNRLKEARKPDGSAYSPAYLNNLIMELSEIFNYAVRFYQLPQNPVKVAGNTAGHKVKSLNFWTREEFNKFIETFAPDSPHYIIFTLLYYSGMREGELLALTPEDVDYSAHTVRINKTYHMIAGKDVVTAPKTKKANRTIVLPLFVTDALRSYQRRIYGIKGSDRLFPYSDTNIDKKMREHAQRAGVKKIRVHDLRHSHASLLIELGFSALLVAERLGHENVSTTLNIYAHLFPSKQSEVADKLQQIYDTDLILKSDTKENNGENTDIKPHKTEQKQT